MTYPVILSAIGNELAEAIDDELHRARKKFPAARHLTVALLEEAGELAKAQLRRENKDAIQKEAIQVCALAIRIIQEGDADLSDLTDEDVQP